MHRVTTALLMLALMCAAAPATQASDWIYYTKPGDNLWDLCLKYTNKRGCWIELAKYNGVRNDRAIPIGNEIRIPAHWLSSPPIVGSVAAVSGAVSYYQGGLAAAVPLQQGQPLHLGARLVSQQGSARLTLGVGNELLMRANTVLELDTMSGPAGARISAELGLPEGDVEVSIEPDGKSRFQISTPAAIAAVRGTQYRVNSRADSMRSEVLSGSVEVAAGPAAQLVPAGFGVAANKGQAPDAPRKLLAAPIFTQSYAAITLPATVDWDANPSAASWLLDVLEDRPGGALLESYPTGKPSHTLDALAQGCYQLQVRAIDGEGFNGLSSSAQLCIVPRLATAADLSPITSDPTTGKMQLSWSPVTGAQSYRLEVATNNTFEDIVETQFTSATAIEFNRSATVPFSVRVIAIDAAGNESPASSNRDFRPATETPWDLIILTLGVLLILI